MDNYSKYKNPDGKHSGLKNIKSVNWLLFSVRILKNLKIEELSLSSDSKEKKLISCIQGFQK